MRKLVVLGAAALAGAAVAVVPALAANQNVTVSDDKFEPATVTVSVGETVTWDYPSGASQHNVSFDDGSYKQPPVATPPGVGWPVSRKFDTPGEFTYICDVHPVTMKGKVVVVAAGGQGGTTTGSTQPQTTDTTAQTGTPADADAPAVSKLRLKAQRKQLRLSFTIDEAARLAVRVRRNGKVVLSRTITVDGAGKQALKIKGAVPKGKLTVALTFIDDAGNRTTRTLKTTRA